MLVKSINDSVEKHSGKEVFRIKMIMA
ncbi:hypothetical protein JV46_12620 [Solemya velum gill symbiont]|uniref:Uncharacterized protein n=1 Tax=Solemya velum gill symbiont TaxID=2340 RepID=A0A0B0H607_SOVGS|nr:hypothetical protein JV46_12620 [Solemya velum gill symbiont]